MAISKSLPGVSFSSLPSLSTDLIRLYGGLSESERLLFKRVYRHLWGVVLPFNRAAGSLGCLSFYWAVDMMREKHKLNTSQLSLLSFIFWVSDQGKNYIHSRVVYQANILPAIIGVSVQRVLFSLKQSGYISRSCRDMGAPYLAVSVSRGRPFIKMTAKGINLITGMENDIYKMLLNTSLNDLTGTNKKPG